MSLIRFCIFPKKFISSDSFRVYELNCIKGKFDRELFAQKVFCDPVSEEFFIDELPKGRGRLAIVWLKSGVYDAEGEMALYACQKLNLGSSIKTIKYGRGLRLSSEMKEEMLKHYNPLVEEIEICR